MPRAGGKFISGRKVCTEIRTTLTYCTEIRTLNLMGDSGAVGKGFMKILTFGEARAGLKAVMDEVCTDHSPTVITRQNGEAVVMLSLTDYNSIEEALYLFASPKNASRLLASLDQLKAGKVRRRELDRNDEPKATAAITTEARREKLRRSP